MNAYNITTVWILAGLATWVLHVVYLWDVSTEWLKKESLSLAALITCVVWWPLVLIFVIAIYIKERLLFRKWCKERGVEI